MGRHESRPWNPLIARTFYRRGVIEEWGRGTLRMAELAVSAGLPRPEIEDIGDSVTVRFRRGDVPRSRDRGSDLATRQDAVLALLEQAHEGLSLREIHARLPLHTTVRQVRRALAALRDRGLARSSGPGPGSCWTRVLDGQE